MLCGQGTLAAKGQSGPWHWEAMGPCHERSTVRPDYTQRLGQRSSRQAPRFHRAPGPLGTSPPGRPAFVYFIGKASMPRPLALRTLKSTPPAGIRSP